MNVSAKDLIFYDSKDNVMCRLGTPEGLRSLETCAPDTKFAIGSLFYSKLQLLLKYKKDGSATVSFIKGYEFPEHNDNDWLRYWWVLLIILIVIIMIFIVLK